MKRPVGLILSAIALSVAALFLLLSAALTAFTGIFAVYQRSPVLSPHFLLYLMLATSIFYAALAVWAILTVIGILRLRPWARYSILIIAGGLTFIGFSAILFSVTVGRTIMAGVEAQQPAADPHIMSIVLIFMTAICLTIGGAGIWWLTYFNLRSTRELFSHPGILVGSSNHLSRVPTAIKIIGVVFLFSSIGGLFCTLLPFPTFILGLIVPASAAHIFFLCLAVTTALAGYGLLRLKEPARLLAAGFLLFGCFHCLLSFLPWYQAQFRLYATQVSASMPLVPGSPRTVFTYNGAFFLVFGIFGLALYGYVLWLLHRHRSAFQASASPPSPMVVA